jgi:hypothetical protein
LASDPGSFLASAEVQSERTAVYVEAVGDFDDVGSGARIIGARVEAYPDIRVPGARYQDPMYFDRCVYAEPRWDTGCVVKDVEGALRRCHVRPQDVRVDDVLHVN